MPDYMMNDQLFIAMFSVFIFWIGCCMGSFLNVCIWRIPRGESIISPSSHCPNCNRSIPIWYNVPIFA
ncbi:MAG: prepilin peptidase, partial [Lentisphaeria bacterium]